MGSVARFGLSTFFESRSDQGFPYWTLIINVAGSMALGFLMRLSMDTAVVSPEMRLLLTTGFCGGFTTFSAFSYESVQLLDRGEFARAGLYIAASVILCIVGTILGLGFARRAFGNDGLA